MKVDFVTCCYSKDAPRLHRPGLLAKVVAGHNYDFHEIIVVHQNCGDIQLEPFTDIKVRSVRTEDHPNVLTDFGLPENDPDADFWTHGPTSAHYWKWHVINHLTALKESTADYIVFSDSDCTMVANGPPSWVEIGVEALQRYQDVLIVSPSEGGKEMVRRVPEGRIVDTFSQQLFLCRREQFSQINFNVPFDSSALYEDPSKRTSNVLAPYGPLQEFYFMLEGRISRYCLSRFNKTRKSDMYRLLLRDEWRYWHWQGKIGGLDD